MGHDEEEDGSTMFSFWSRIVLFHITFLLSRLHHLQHRRPRANTSFLNPSKPCSTWPSHTPWPLWTGPTWGSSQLFLFLRIGLCTLHPMILMTSRLSPLPSPMIPTTLCSPATNPLVPCLGTRQPRDITSLVRLGWKAHMRCPCKILEGPSAVEYINLLTDFL